MSTNEASTSCGLVILNYFTANLTEELCKIIMQASLDIKLKIYIVDNSCSLQEWQRLQHFNVKFEDITIIRQNKNVGYGAGNHVGVKKAIDDGCTGVIICNPDIQFDKPKIFEDFVKRIQFSLHSDAPALIAAPQVFNPYTNAEENPIYEPHFFTEIFGFNKPSAMFSFCGCFFFMNYRALQAIELFPTDVFMYNEELIIGKKLQQNISDLLFIEDITVLHCHKKYFKNFRSEFLRKHHQIKSRLYVFRTYFSGGFVATLSLFILLWLRGFVTLFIKWFLTRISNI